VIAASFAHTWVWPAGGSGGIWGDVVGSLLWAVIVAALATIFWPPLRHAVERLFHRVFSSHPIHSEIAELHRKLDHIIDKHPQLPPLEDHDGNS
jgi:hypothetical protein